MILIVLIALFGYGTQNEDTPKSELEKYSIAYTYIISNDSVVHQINQAFKNIKRKEKENIGTYCINDRLQPLVLTGFSSFKHSNLKQELRKIDFKDLPVAISQFSKCMEKETKYNMSFSVVYKNALIVDISLKNFNPLGGSSMGPSIKFLLMFDDRNVIKEVYHQTFISG
ncbi:MAG TPA: hypothetical protein VJ953_22015 [Saprospiraceae bacterium]|nr:hypothetical protein [Saprospiraceae bacterium]